MKFKWTSSNLFIIKFLISLLIIGIILGFIIYYQQVDLTKDSIKLELEGLANVLDTKQNNFTYHIILFSVLMVLSLIVIGLPLIFFYFFYEGVSFGFLLASFFDFKGVEGILFGLILGIINKLIIFIALIYLLLTGVRYGKRMFLSIKNKDFKIYEYMTNQIFKHIFVLAIVIIVDIIIYFWGNILLSYFLFLL